MLIDMSAPLLASTVAGCNPLRMRTPSTITSASNPTPMADNVLGVLLPLANSFCTAFSSSSVLITDSSLAALESMEFCACAV
jgi:hypothetical protein